VTQAIRPGMQPGWSMFWFCVPSCPGAHVPFGTSVTPSGPRTITGVCDAQRFYAENR